MESRVTWDGKYSGISINWHKLVMDPSDKGYFIQAFASADAILDSVSESILRQIFNSFESQTLINNIHNLRGNVGFDGLMIFVLLRNKDVISEGLLSRIRKFKKVRNLVLHNIEAEYKLLEYPEMKDVIDQKIYDAKVRSKAKDELREAYNIFEALLNVSSDIAGNEKDFLLKGNGVTKKPY